MRMSYLTDNINRLDQDLAAQPMRIAAHKDMPAAIFCYPPAEEYLLRKQLRLLAIKLAQKQKNVIFVSLSRLVNEVIRDYAGTEYLFETESRRSFLAAQQHVNHLLTSADFKPAADALLERVSGCDPDKDILFLVRAGGFAPYIYRCSVLLDGLQRPDRRMVPTILFYPGSRKAGADLRFYDLPVVGVLGVYNYRVKIYGEES
jgi:hypothetical protein